MLTSTETDLATARERLRAADARILRLLQRVEQLEHQAHHDTLTGLLNRAGLIDAWDCYLQTDRTPAALILLDLDGFKAVNDEYGHAVGDQLLAAVGDLLAHTCRELVARHGGDEFVVVVPAGIDPEATAGLLADALAGVGIGGARIRGASIGVATTDDTSDLGELLQRADAAMYHAKASGRGRYAVWCPDGTPALEPVPPARRAHRGRRTEVAW